MRFSGLFLFVFSFVTATHCWGASKNFSAFLQNHCIECHGVKKQKGDLRLDQWQDLAPKEESELWHGVLERLSAREMPPEDHPQPSESEFRDAIFEVETLLETALSRTLAYGDWAFPSHGNATQHEWLFPKDGDRRDLAASTPPRIWRLSPYIYRENTDELTRGYMIIDQGKLQRRSINDRNRGRPALPSPYGLSGANEFRDYAFQYRVSQSEVEQLARNARTTVELMLTSSGPNRAPKVLQEIADSESEVSLEQVQTAVTYLFQIALRRVPTGGELERYSEFTHRNIQKLGNRSGLTLGLSGVLMHPEAIFRLEFGTGKPDEHGRLRMSPHEIAHAISYALTDRRPNERLLEAARSGKLETEEDVAREVRQILEDPEMPKPRILRFFREYFGYYRATDVFKDEPIIKAAGYQKYYPENLVEDTDRLVLHILEKDQEVLKELLTTDLSFISVSSLPNWLKFANRRAEQAKEKGEEPPKHPFDKKNKLHTHYNFPVEDWSEKMPLKLNSEQRAGILTQPSWLIAYSTNEHNHAILRGKWIRERLLGGRIPDTPITVDAQLPHQPDNILRDRMRVTLEEYCWKCHERMDPLGLPFQIFDHFGRFRTEELGRPVDASGKIVSSGESTLDGPVTDALDLIRKLAKSERVEQVFVRHAFRYWVGRNEQKEDAQVMQNAWKAYRESGGSMNALIVSLLSSDSFLFRKVSTKVSAP
jgi:hypothetical protein